MIQSPSAVLTLRTSSPGERPYVCSVCGKRFSQANALNAHAETHEAKSLHMCPFCPKKFRNRPRLACHIRLMHQAEVQVRASGDAVGRMMRQDVFHWLVYCVDDEKARA